MKPKTQNSAFKTPLNHILGSKSHISVLRHLTETEHPISHSELIDRVALSRQGVYDAVRRLTETGIVRYVGSGTRQQIVLRKEHPLTDTISKLFAIERARFDELFQDLKKEIKNLELKPHSAWIFGKVAQGLDTYGESMRIALLGDVQSIDDMTDALRDQLYDTKIEKRYDVTIDIREITLADLEAENNLYSQIILLWGPDPRHYLQDVESGNTEIKAHRDFDQQSVSDAETWTELLQTNPEIISRTIEYLQKQLSQINSGEKKELQEWKHILESMPFQRLKKFLESDEARAVRLRQSLPFWPVLKANEREKLEKIKSKKV